MIRTIKTCDRCKHIIGNGEYSGVVQYSRSKKLMDRGVIYDLCRECAREFRHWMIELENNSDESSDE